MPYVGGNVEKRHNLLLVDDEEEILFFMSKLLGEMGFKVFCAPDGEEALKLFEIHSIDIVLMDLSLKKTSGLDVLEKINNYRRNSPDPAVKYGKTSYLLMTGRVDQFDQRKARILGVEHFLAKPFDQALLMDTMSQVVFEVEAAS